MAFGFLVDRTTVLLAQPGSKTNAGFWIGLGFVVLGVCFSVLSIIQYRRSVAALRPIEIPPRYWVNLSVYASALIGLLGVALAIFLSAA